MFSSMKLHQNRRAAEIAKYSSPTDICQSTSAFDLYLSVPALHEFRIHCSDKSTGCNQNVASSGNFTVLPGTPAVISKPVIRDRPESRLAVGHIIPVQESPNRPRPRRIRNFEGVIEKSPDERKKKRGVRIYFLHCCLEAGGFFFSDLIQLGLN